MYEELVAARQEHLFYSFDQYEVWMNSRIILYGEKVSETSANIPFSAFQDHHGKTGGKSYPIKIFNGFY